MYCPQHRWIPNPLIVLSAMIPLKLPNKKPFCKPSFSHTPSAVYSQLLSHGPLRRPTNYPPVRCHLSLKPSTSYTPQLHIYTPFMCASLLRSFLVSSDISLTFFYKQPAYNTNDVAVHSDTWDLLATVRDTSRLSNLAIAEMEDDITPLVSDDDDG